MTLKNDWGTGDTYNASDMNALATQVNENVLAANGDGTYSTVGDPSLKLVDVSGTTPIDASAEVKSAIGIPTVYVEDYRDGVRTDNEILLAAFDAVGAGGEIQFGKGVTYTLTSVLEVGLSDKPGVHINGQGATLYSTLGGDVKLFVVKGHRYSASATTLTAAITERTDTLTVADTTTLDEDGTTWTAGDMVLIESDEIWSPDSVTANKTEVGIVKDVVDGTTLVLRDRTWKTYSITGYTVNLYRYKQMKNIIVSDLKIVGADDGVTEQGAFSPRYFENLTVRNVFTYGTARTGFTPLEGINGSFIDCRAGRHNKVSNQGVGFSPYQTTAAKFIGCYAWECRHGFDSHESHDTTFLACSAYDTTAAGISTHAAADTVKVVDCTTRNTGGGIIVRGSNSTVRNCHVSDVKPRSQQGSYRAGITIGNGSATYNGIGGVNLIIEGCTIDLSGPDYSAESSLSEPDSGIYSPAPLVNARIINNVISGFPSCGIAAVGDINTGVRISGNTIDCSSQQNSSTTHGIYLNPADTAADNVHTNIVVENNDFPNGSAASAISITGGSTSSPVTDNIQIRWNDVRDACGTAAIELDDGNYGSNIAIYGNKFTDDDPIQGTWTNFDVSPYIGCNGYGRNPRPLGLGQEMGARLYHGRYYGPAGSTGTGATTLNRLSAIPFFVDRRVIIDRIGINVTTGSGTGGSQALLGIYTDSGDTDIDEGGIPHSLVSGSEGSVATDGVAFVEATISCVLNPGLYWLACVPQTAAPSVTTLASQGSQVVGYQSSGLSAGRVGYTVNSVTGALPSTWSGSTVNGSLPYVQVRVSSSSTVL